MPKTNFKYFLEMAETYPNSPQFSSVALRHMVRNAGGNPDSEGPYVVVCESEPASSASTTPNSSPRSTGNSSTLSEATDGFQQFKM